MLQNGPGRRGRTPIVGPQSPNLLWRISTETNYGGAVIGRDGTAYIGNLLGQFLAVRPNGTIKWTISLSHTVESTPAILLDGRIAFVAANGTLFVLNPDGSPSWSFETGVTCTCTETSPAIGRDGTIYFASGEILYALYADGSVRWTYESVYDIVGPPAVSPDGVVYFPSGALIAVDANGSLLWQSPLFAPQGTPAIGVDGTIYVNSASPIHLYAFTPNGALKWRYRVVGGSDPGLASSPAIDVDGTIYVGETVDVGGEADGLVLALNPDGTLKWEAHHGRWPTAISIGGDGTIYFGSGSQNPPTFYALNPDGTLKWQYEDSQGGYARTPPAIGKGHRIYAGSLGGFFAIGA
jgi:outer membrane protein assembly factor BamB